MNHNPGHDEYIGRCMNCSRKFCWPKAANTTHVQNGGGKKFTCPVCNKGLVIQTSRMGMRSDFNHLYEHQAGNLQAVAR